MNQKKTDNGITEKIVTYFGYFEEYSLRSIAKTCARLIISEYFTEICNNTFEIPAYDEVRKWVVEEMKQDFDEKVMPLIEQTYPDFTDEELDREAQRLEKEYEKEHQEQVESTTKAAYKELRILVKSLQKELKTLKRKYTV